ncbi:DUF6672 family protein [Treponema brennaborense]|uniref:Uncharacterized protein n=1 Tax=Treponema brennaborense (strain DSM 12168 / CIP 105900 / DD5/3) TaxID=906968 RepID=F4LN02_TREBD|nr:DUF6672 family protein [Treponema brennaborense]AEE15788.1 hypothetical protein Trebr_0341 [Treponema brennaborense DSM 12168]
MMINKKTAAVRAALAAAYVLLLVCMFVTGRTHTLLVDNKAAEDGSFTAVRGMEVTVNKGEPVEFMKGDRDKFTVKGQTVRLHVEFFDGTEACDFKVKIPLSQDMVLLSIPKLLAGIEPAMEPFDSL